MRHIIPILVLTVALAGGCSFFKDTRPLALCNVAIDNCAKPRQAADTLVYAGASAEFEAKVKALDATIGKNEHSCTAAAAKGDVGSVNVLVGLLDTDCKLLSDLTGSK